MPASRGDQAKRAFVAALCSVAGNYGLAAPAKRDSTDADLNAAFRAIARAARPDKGGRLEDSQRLHKARDDWQAAARAPGKAGRPRQCAQPRGHETDKDVKVGLPIAEGPSRRQFRIRGEAALFTYQGVADLAQFRRLVAFVSEHVKAWGVKHWCATLETNADGSPHARVMLQFLASVDRGASGFAFEGLRPNVSPNDLLGEGVCRKKKQLSIDRAFYVWADKEGTQRDEHGALCVLGNYAPCWTDAAYRYQVLGAWPEKLWKHRKLSHRKYEEYLYLCRDGVPGRKRNLDAVCNRECEVADAAEIEATTKRVRSTLGLYKAFPRVPEADEWLAPFQSDRLRYPILIVLGPSYSGKTEWAKSIFAQLYELKIGSLMYFPDGTRGFNRRAHDGLVLDDVRDLRVLADRQDKLQGKYDAAVEFASTPGGACSYTKFTFAVPIVVTINCSTKNLTCLESHDWLGNASNRVVVQSPVVL